MFVGTYFGKRCVQTVQGDNLHEVMRDLDLISKGASEAVNFIMVEGVVSELKVYYKDGTMLTVDQKEESEYK